MSDYLKCDGCGQVVQGFEAAMQTECCDKPMYKYTTNPLADALEERLGYRPITTVAAHPEISARLLELLEEEDGGE